jgi:exopolysaccharide production protein ExoQ
VYEDARKAPLWEQAFYTIWLFAVFMPIDAFQPIRYLCIAGLLGILAIHRNEVFPLMLKAWPLFPIPIFACFSIFWTPYPGDAPKSAALLMLTPILLVVLAARLRAVEFLRLTMFAGWLGTLYSLPYFATFADGGPYAQKNSLAFHMMLVILTSLGTALNDEEPAPIRMIAAVFVPVAFVIQYLADSATSLVFAVAGSAVLIGIKLVWTGVSQVRHMRTTMLVFLFGLGLTGFLIILSMPNQSFVDDFLALVGKDSSLTGRTAIWNAAERVSAEHPWFGVGIEGFWNPLTGIAQTLNENDSKPFGTKLSFHSAFWETRVHFGWIGLGMFILAIGWSGVRTLSLWLREGNLVNSTILLMYVVIFTSCFTESYASGTTNMMVYFLYFGGLAAFGHGERKYLGIGRLVERPG